MRLVSFWISGSITTALCAIPIFFFVEIGCLFLLWWLRSMHISAKLYEWPSPKRTFLFIFKAGNSVREPILEQVGFHQIDSWTFETKTKISELPGLWDLILKSFPWITRTFVLNKSPEICGEDDSPGAVELLPSWPRSRYLHSSNASVRGWCCSLEYRGGSSWGTWKIIVQYALKKILRCILEPLLVCWSRVLKTNGSNVYPARKHHP